VLVGHNEHIAWGMTLAFTDCEDLFVEKMDPERPYHYQFQGEWVAAEVVEETIPVKGRKEPHVEPVVVTRHGPIISDVVGYGNERLALQSMALRPSPAMQGWFQLNTAAGWDDFVEAVAAGEEPPINNRDVFQTAQACLMARESADAGGAVNPFYQQFGLLTVSGARHKVALHLVEVVI